MAIQSIRSLSIKNAFSAVVPVLVIGGTTYAVAVTGYSVIKVAVFKILALGKLLISTTPGAIFLSAITSVIGVGGIFLLIVIIVDKIFG